MKLEYLCSMGNESKSMQNIHNVAIVGARGYSGLELARILMNHPSAKLTHCFATQNNWKLSDYFENSEASNVKISDMNEIETVAKDLHTVFLATPAEVSMELAPKLLAKGVNVIDLSGAFRLPVDLFEKFYAHKHSAPELLEKAQFGLLPWAGPLKAERGAKLIANPGCYATSVFMALLPLIRGKAIKPETLVIDAKSGATGAGKKASENLLFTEVEGECLPYRVGKHQHLPEICHYTKAFAGIEIDPMFTTHLLPVRRGIISGIYARLNPSFGQGAEAETKIASLYKEAYSGYPLVNMGKAQGSLLSLKRVVGTARTQISYTVEGDKLYVFSALDNLMKGAASQAVENFNRLLDQPLASGLTSMASMEGQI
jgi:N-acetyl-gamma-glutamyl-phosphate reductase